ncbi:MAG: lipid II flippase Amj family protein [Clostridiales bacterium]|nr:lipid II flippase Amj family protein [Clostridiales bacterium]
MSGRVAAVFFFTAFIHLVDTLAYAVRPAGVQTGRLATSISLFNVLALSSRTANLIQLPLLGSLVDLALLRGDIHSLEREFRGFLLAATLGALLGAFFIPSFVRIFTAAIRRFDRAGSVLPLIFSLLKPDTLKAAWQKVKPPTPKTLSRLTFSGLPWGFLLLNILITAIYTTGVPAALYAGSLVPHFRTTASQLSGVINGGATVLFVLFVDPVAALITDQVLEGKRPQGQVYAMAALLAATKIAGTLLAQLIFRPAVFLVVEVTHLIVR